MQKGDFEFGLSHPAALPGVVVSFSDIGLKGYRKIPLSTFADKGDLDDTLYMPSKYMNLNNIAIFVKEDIFKKTTGDASALIAAQKPGVELAAESN